MKYEATGQVTKTITLKDIQAISTFKRNYSAENKEEYESQLKRMALADIQSHAVKVGVTPNNDRRKMEKLLLQQYQRQKLNFEFATGATGSTTSSRNMSDEKKKRIEEIGKHFR